MATAIINEQVDAINSTLGELADDLVTLRPLVKDVKDSVAASYIIDTATGAIASFPDGADGIPVKDLKVAIEPVQSGSGDPSPTNIRPISGWTGALMHVRGTNQWDEQWEVGGWSISGGGTWNTADRIRSKNYIPCLPNTAYYYIAGGKNLQVLFYDANKNYVGYRDFNQAHLFTTPSDCNFMKISGSSAYGTTYNHDICINYPSTDHDYHAYNGNTYPISWQTEAGTVYGGTLDVTTGKLLINKRGVDLGTFNYWTSVTSDYRTVYCDVNHLVYNANNPTIICDRYKSVAVNSGASSADTNYIYIYNRTSSQNCIAIKDASLAGLTRDQIKSALTGTFVVYDIDNPTEVDLTPTEVETVLGQNNIWANCGDVDVEYRADTKLYINKMIANALNA